jgi:hypothetical protein
MLWREGRKGRGRAGLGASFCDSEKRRSTASSSNASTQTLLPSLPLRPRACFCPQALEETLEKVVKLLAYISDKDLFAEFYRKKLARRLLHDKSSSDDHERSILSRLKQQCGAQVR